MPGNNPITLLSLRAFIGNGYHHFKFIFPQVKSTIMKKQNKPLRFILLLLIALLLQCRPHTAFAQNEQNIWAFGYRMGMDFNNPTPAFYPNQILPGDGGCASICNASGQMLFYTNGYWIWNRDNELLPEFTNGVSGYSSPVSPNIGYPPLTGWTGGMSTQSTAIAGMPAHPGRYFVFTLSESGQLSYTQVDMALHAGKGGIVTGMKGIYMDASLAEKLTVVKGCNSIWLIVRAKNSNQYKAYEINDTGIALTPVVSICGSLPLPWYRCGVIKFSPDGTKMAAACNDANNSRGGLELYDFNPQSGMLSNAAVLDSSSTTGYYYGACFSPDSKVLYATTCSFSIGTIFNTGKVHQFNCSLPTAAAIAASNTVVYNNPVYDGDVLGDLKRAPDGKIYFGGGNAFLSSINNPNVTGAACNPQSNVLALPSDNRERCLPNDIVLLSPPDSITARKQTAICFKQNAILQADTGKRYVWDNGSTNRTRNIDTEGLYIVHYINLDCQYETDSIFVRFIPLPSLYSNSYSCPDQKQGRALVQQPVNDTNTFEYQWKDINGSVLKDRISNHGDTLTNVDTGLHYVQITTASGCDTTLSFTIQSLPKPESDFTYDSIACKGTPVSFVNTSSTDALVSKWYFGDGNFSNLQSTDYAYGQTGDYTVTLITTNIEGCSDTIQKEMEVKGLDLQLYTDRDWVDRGEQVRLSTSANETYTIFAWGPSYLCPEQTVFSQTITMDTTQTIWVNGISGYGCKDKASVQINVRPVIMVPSAFSPNGDGLNDRFGITNTGNVFIRAFEVYNRYGQQVFSAFGSAALQGWDGTFKGQLQDMGVYYYLVTADTKENKNITLKGDVTLIR